MTVAINGCIMGSTVKPKQYALTTPIVGSKEALFISAKHLIVIAVNIVVRYLTRGMRQSDRLGVFKACLKIIREQPIVIKRNSHSLSP